jgi:uncharacterized SAM-dependent methyltransferase
MSRTALARCEIELGHIDCVSIVGFEREYLDGLVEVSARRRPGEHLLVLFLGSTIGNFERPAAVQFLRQIREALTQGDALLLGTDLQSSVPALIRAYDDPLGVTGAFNLNLLARINRELEADFVLSQFRHAVRYDPAEHRIEMHLRSVAEQTVSVSRADLTVSFKKDETIWTESCHKFTREGTVALAESSGFLCDAQWVDREWPFAQSLLVAA